MAFRDKQAAGIAFHKELSFYRAMLRFRFALAAAGLAIGSIAAAQAQSFDCRKAETAVEKAICDRRDLSALDFELESAFRRALKGSGDRHAAMLSDQRAFIKDRDADCARLASDVAQMAACIKNAYRARIRELRSAE